VRRTEFTDPTAKPFKPLGLLEMTFFAVMISSKQIAQKEFSL